MKICSKCGLEKDLSEFYKHKKTKDGLHSKCKICHKKYNQTPEIKERVKKYNQTLKVKEYKKQRSQTPKYKYSDYKYNAKRRGYPFNLTFGQFIEVTNQQCVYCGSFGPNGVDRKNNDEGYTLENSVACCFLCNHMKWNLSIQQLFAHIKKIIKYSVKE